MQRSFGYSLLLHLGVFLVVVFGFPVLFDLKKDPEPQAITVEILPIGKISNVPNAQKPVRKEPPKPQPPKPQKPVQPTKQAPPPPPKKEPVPLPKKEEPKKEEKKPEPKKEEEKPKPQQEDDDFAVLMNKLKQEQPAEEKKEEKAKPAPDAAKSRSDQYDPTLPLSISEKDAIRSQFVKCWRMPAGARGDYELAVKVRVLVNPDGSVKQVGLVPDQRTRYQSDTFFRAAADSAIRAVHSCSPLKNLPPDKYDTWKDMELNFDPQEMLY